MDVLCRHRLRLANMHSIYCWECVLSIFCCRCLAGYVEFGDNTMGWQMDPSDLLRGNNLDAQARASETAQRFGVKRKWEPPEFGCEGTDKFNGAKKAKLDEIGAAQTVPRPQNARLHAKAFSRFNTKGYVNRLTKLITKKKKDGNSLVFIKYPVTNRNPNH